MELKSRLRPDERILYFLSENPPQTFSMLHESPDLAMAKGTISKYMKILREQGLIQIQYQNGLKMNSPTELGYLRAREIAGGQDQMHNYRRYSSLAQKMEKYLQVAEGWLQHQIQPRRLAVEMVMNLVDFDDWDFGRDMPTPNFRVAVAYYMARYQVKFHQGRDFWDQFPPVFALTQTGFRDYFALDEIDLKFYVKRWCQQLQIPFFKDRNGSWWVISLSDMKILDLNIQRWCQSVIQESIIAPNPTPIDILGECGRLFSQFIIPHCQVIDLWLFWEIFQYLWDKFQSYLDLGLKQKRDWSAEYPEQIMREIFYKSLPSKISKSLLHCFEMKMQADKSDLTPKHERNASAKSLRKRNTEITIPEFEIMSQLENHEIYLDHDDLIKGYSQYIESIQCNEQICYRLRDEIDSHPHERIQIDKSVLISLFQLSEKALVDNIKIEFQKIGIPKEEWENYFNQTIKFEGDRPDLQNLIHTLKEIQTNHKKIQD